MAGRAAGATALADAMAMLERRASRAVRDGLARYGIPTDHAIGVRMADIQSIGRAIGRNHDLAGRLWTTGVYEARLLVAYVADPARLSRAEMDRWCRDFDNWGICDTLCFALFDRTPHAWSRVEKWASSRNEFVRRAAFALLWGLTVHDKTAGLEPFVRGLQLVESAATDPRPMVKKAVNMALRATGKRNPPLHAAAVAVAERLAASADGSARWVGKDALGELTSPAVLRRVSRAAGAPRVPQSSRDATTGPRRVGRRR